MYVYISFMSEVNLFIGKGQSRDNKEKRGSYSAPIPQLVTFDDRGCKSFKYLSVKPYTCTCSCKFV